MRFTLLAAAVGLLVQGGKAMADTPPGAAPVVVNAASDVASAAPVAASAASAPPAPAPAPGSAFTSAPAASAPSASARPPQLLPSPSMQPLPRGDAARKLPLILRADSLVSQPDLQTAAEGKVELRRGGMVIRADRLTYDASRDLANAKGQVSIRTDSAVYSGPELQLQLQRFDGFFLEPRFEFPLLGAGGRAQRIDFIDSARAVATAASYSSCPIDGPQDPDWILRASRVRLDLDLNEGIADNAVLRFLGVPILAWPSLSFPLSDARKSGWLPPSVNIDSRSGLELSVPYYWNIAPQRDATISPRVISRRGLAVDTEFRYLEPQARGTLALDWLPNDRVARRARASLNWDHEGEFDRLWFYRAEVARVTDDDWWKDFPNHNSRNLTTRLLPLRLALERQFALPGLDGLAYVRTQRWQLLQSVDSPIAPPYQRSPQIGMQLTGLAGRWLYKVETEFNRFTLPGDNAVRAGRSEGDRWHLLGSFSRTFKDGGLWLVPRLALNAARYATDRPAAGTPRVASRAIPSLSVDAGFELERQTSFFGRVLRQTLEPRLLYVNTPYRAQSQLPNYDSAAKDFNFVSIFTDNAFSGIDRVADAHQITAGLTTRLVDAGGGEALRLGVIQRYLLRPQQVAPQPDGSADGPPLTQKFSDALLVGSTNVLPSWTLDAALQFSPEIHRAVRTVVGARYSPGPFRTVSTTYRLTRGLSEQLELGWQWPVWGNPATAEPKSRSASSSGNCSGAWYSVGRVNYSLKDSRITDSVLGLEYDAGCWIGRIVAERLSTGRSEATTRLLLQLELVGLSRIGSNPLKVLKDNIPGYRLLREERTNAPRSDEWQPVP